jgi:hypothetical protein
MQYAVRPGFDAQMAGKAAECDGGQAVPGTHMATRQEFTGTLTGEYIDHADPPWRWYLMVNLTRKPDGYEHDAVWCESGCLWPLDGSEPNHPSRRA